MEVTRKIEPVTMVTRPAPHKSQAVTKAKDAQAPVAASPAEARLRLYLAACGVEHEPVLTHTVQRLMTEAHRLFGDQPDDVRAQTLLTLAIDHHRVQMPVQRPVSPTVTRRAMKPRRLRPIFARLARWVRLKAWQYQQACERADARHVRPPLASERL